MTEESGAKLVTIVFSPNHALYHIEQMVGDKKMWLSTEKYRGAGEYIMPQGGFLGAVACAGGWRKAYDLNWPSVWAESRQTRSEEDELVVDYARAKIAEEPEAND